jgi:GNAT superfamily N-acetyltransferase
MKIREATKQDYKRLMELYNDFVGSDRYSNHDNDSFERTLEDPDCYIYVAEEDNQMIGFVTFSVRNVVRYKKPIAEGDELYVMPEYRGKGYGKQLMQHIINKATELNCHRMFLESHYKHETAHKMYESMGFTNYGYHFIKDL